ncbi:protein O-linked-mannose beta-1,4-N-acetylglucosaminyltransferase 2-like [Senna tora]|uniref:Protein O-linked-mannose beta-1,4-N-acetylglucosaminyltransferase 2-like n=1 Tax=Senna tora TaxID=362788 RepID=A0A834WQF1_9FABA|nr:protein O-linked-mannose beta-1,4-N-acetylglucosaminyltransferase 2-like [Senna tora]
MLFLGLQIKYSPSFTHTIFPIPQESVGPRVAQLDPTFTKQNVWGPHHSPEKQITCDRSHHSYDICSIHVPTVLDPTTSTFFINRPSSSITHSPNPTVTKIRPYPRKWENFTMSRIKELTITSQQPIPKCHVAHKSPALIFSAGGYTGNFFHEFNDGFVPLFITVNSMFHHDVDDGNDPDRDIVLVISKARDWWVSKYAKLLRQFSMHKIIDLDNDNSTHCFPSATIGLISHGFLTINQELMPNSKSLNHFHEFLSKAYNGENHHSPNILHHRPNSRPRLVLANRPLGVGRALLNLEEVKSEVKKVGFDLIMFEPTPKVPLHQSFGLINSSHVMVGVHGAALTHMLFLRPGAVFVQVVPLGIEWVAETCFGNAAKARGLNYMDYRVRVEESSLIEKYRKEDMVIKNPSEYIKGKPWSSGMDIYLREQNVRLDLVRFRKYLKKAYKKAKELMDKEG